MQIREERPEDKTAIFDLTKAAFKPMPFSDGTEAEAIDRLRADGDLIWSFVAIEDAVVVGHIAFSPAFLTGSEDGWMGLGPVAVDPGRQQQGIGSRLIKYGLDVLRQNGAPGCVLIGDPKYYSRFGFIGDGRISYRNLPPENVQWLAFGAKKPSGVVTFSPGLE